MKKATQGIETDELMKQLDNNLQYVGAKRLTDFEIELLDQIDTMCDTRIKMQRDLESEKYDNEKMRDRIAKTDMAIDEYCSETTKNKILLATGWQFKPEKMEQIKRALSDKYIIERLIKRNIVETYESSQIKKSDISKSKEMLSSTLNKEKQNDIEDER